MNRVTACVAPALMLGVATSGVAQTIVPVDQSRELRGFVIVPPCAPGGLSRLLEAPDFGPFIEDLEVRRECPEALGRTLTSMNSTFREANIVAGGEATCQGAAQSNTVIHAIGSSTLDVTFDLTERARFEVIGNLIVENAVVPLGTRSSVTLVDAGDETVFAFTITGRPGERLSENFREDGVLSAGRYRMSASAAANLDASIPPEAIGYALFNFYLMVFEACRADWNEDGRVNTKDLFDFLAAFFAGDADFNADGRTDSEDFFDFVAEFLGSGCE